VPTVATAQIPAPSTPLTLDTVPQPRQVMRTHTTTGLVQAARGRDPLAWEELVARYGGLVRGVVAAYRLQEADAADAVQNTWLRAVERLDTIRDPERLGGWLKTTAARECLALLRHSHREVPADAGTMTVVERAPEPETIVLDAEAHGAVSEAVDRLTGRRRLLVHALFYMPDLGYSEMSRMIGIPVGSIGPSRGRMLRHLRCGLEKAGFGADRAIA
jgi:RNA polymerase sigma factor (sigma-70 family)